ncbi:MAG: alpha/beta fold hydrolase [Acidobacteria bacterium]|nr:alpha/beta fold hydrolase [Acidobacteriota bacterium]MCW5969258.1 alpha/beta fold hydrolase [Blastocatellales bacterium]
MLSEIEQDRLQVSKNTDARKKSQFGQFLTPAATADFMGGLFPHTDGDCRSGAGIGSPSAAFLERWRSGGLTFRPLSALLVAVMVMLPSCQSGQRAVSKADNPVAASGNSPKAFAQERITFSTRDGALIYGDLYGSGAHGVVLVHGGRFNKESWRNQALRLVDAGLRILAIDLRGYGESRAAASASEDARYLDVLGAVEYLRQNGAATVSVVGASMGGDYAAEAAEADPDKIDRLVLLAAGAYTPLIKSKARKLFIMSRDDIIGENTPRLPRIRSRYEAASDPKEFIVLEGSAHAQFLFETDQGERLMQEILRFLSLP